MSGASLAGCAKVGLHSTAYQQRGTATIPPPFSASPNPRFERVQLLAASRWQLPVPFAAGLGEFIRVRFRDIDAPELGGRAACPQEAALAIASRDWVIAVPKHARKIRLINLAPADFNRYQAEVHAASATWARSLSSKA